MSFRPPRVPIRTASRALRDLFEIMEAEGIHQTEVAQQLALTSATVSHWRSGVSEPTITYTEALAQVLGYRIIVEKVK